MQRNKLSQNTYYHPDYNKKWLEKNEFRYNKVLSSVNEGDVYVLRFPVIFWNMYATIEAEISFNITDNIAHINCYDKGTRSIYASWYSVDNAHMDIVNKINSIIYKKLDELGFLFLSSNRNGLFEVPRKEEKNVKCNSKF